MTDELGPVRAAGAGARTDELDAVRRLGAHEAVPDAAARERVRERVFAPPPAPRRRRLLTAAVPAGAVALGAVLVLSLGGGGRSAPAPEYTGGGGEIARVPSLFPARDEFLYVRSRGRFIVCRGRRDCRLGPERVREVWASGHRAGRIVEKPSAEGPSRLAPFFFHLGGRLFTYAQLAAYRPSPRELLRTLRRYSGPNQHDRGASYPFAWLTVPMREVPMPVAVRRAIFHALPLVPGVEELGPTTDGEGRPGVGFARNADGVREQVVIDPEALTLLEHRSVVVDPAASGAHGFPKGATLSTAIYLERAVVRRAGQRP